MTSIEDLISGKEELPMPEPTDAEKLAETVFPSKPAPTKPARFIPNWEEPDELVLAKKVLLVIAEELGKYIRKNKHHAEAWTAFIHILSQVNNQLNQ